jgi:subtilisin family serine protease
MKTTTKFLTWAAAGMIAGLAPLTRGQEAGEAVPDRYIVQLKPGVPAAATAREHGVIPIHVFGRVANGYAGFIPPGLLPRVVSDSRVEAVIPDRVMTIQAKPGGGGGSSGQVVPAGVVRIGAAPGQVGYTGSGVGVAIVDTGIDLNHADLGGPVAAFSAFGGSPQDDQGHGTHVAGIVAARNNTRDVVGVAPEATLYAVKVLNAKGSGTDSDVMAGLEWIANNAVTVIPPIQVANLSLGRPGTLNDNPALRAAFQEVVAAGVTVVVSAGNDCAAEVSQMVPATYPEVIAVASTTARDGTSAYASLKIRADTASYFTTDGAFDPGSGIGVTISAPGEEQENILRGYRLSSVGILSTKLGGGTVRMSGTSMAAPHVAGVAALLYQKNSSLLPEDIRSLLMAGADNPAAPLDSPTSCYSFDGDREGVVYAPNALSLAP